MALHGTSAGSLMITTLQHLDVRDSHFQNFEKMILILISCVDSKLAIILNIVTSTTVVVMYVMTLVGTVKHVAMNTILI